MDFVKNYLTDLRQVLGELDDEAIAQAITWLQEARDQGNWLYACGNGGSSSIAGQMVVDMVKCASDGRDCKFRMLSLTDSIATVTAFANDVSYDYVFEGQLRSLARPGDVLLAISGSGNSTNVVNAVRYANELGCRTIGLTTNRGGQLKDLVQLPLVVPSSHMGRLEDSFFIMTHIMIYAFVDQAVD